MVDKPLIPKNHVDYDSFSEFGSDEKESDSKCLAFLDRNLPPQNGRRFTYNFTGNILAGLTVSLINVPLSMSLAVAAHCSPLMGMSTAIFGGFFAAVFGGSHYNIVGPTGALSGILAAYSIQFGPQVIPLLAVIAAAAMVFVWFFGWDSYVGFLPSSVNHGFTLGVAFIIAGGQLAAALGISGLPTHQEFIQNLGETLAHLDRTQWFPLIVALGLWISLYTLVRINNRIPWSVLIAVIGIVLGYLSDHGYIPQLITLRDKFGELAISKIIQPQWANWSLSKLPPIAGLIRASISVAFIAVLETLISGKIADGITRTQMDPSREVLGCCLANLASGLLGGVPATAALARTALNIRAGGTSRLSALWNAIFTCIFSLALLPVFSYLCLPAVAALLFQVAVGMVETKHLVRYFHMDWGSLLLALLVAILCVVVDPTTGLLAGFVIGLLRFAQAAALGHAEFTVKSDPSHPALPSLLRHSSAASIDAYLRNPETPTSLVLREGEIIVYRVVGKLTFLNALQHSNRIQGIVKLLPADPQFSHVIVISLRHCFYVDLDGLEALEEIYDSLVEAHKVVFMTGISGGIRDLFMKCEWYRKVEMDGFVVARAADVPQIMKQRGIKQNSGIEYQTTRQVQIVGEEHDASEEGTPPRRRG